MKEQILKVPFAKKLKNNIKGLGIASQLVIDTFVCIIKGQINIKNTIIQMVEVGYMSFPIVLLTSFFVGMVLALQVGSATANLFNEPVYIGMITGYSLVKELGPVLTSVVITGRIGAAITAEIGTMKVTEQIDALYTLGTNPVRYLAVPRFIACILMLPLLVAISNIVGIYASIIFNLEYSFNCLHRRHFRRYDSSSIFTWFYKIIFLCWYTCYSCMS